MESKLPPVLADEEIPIWLPTDKYWRECADEDGAIQKYKLRMDKPSFLEGAQRQREADVKWFIEWMEANHLPEFWKGSAREEKLWREFKKLAEGGE